MFDGGLPEAQKGGGIRSGDKRYGPSKREPHRDEVASFRLPDQRHGVWDRVGTLDDPGQPSVGKTRHCTHGHPARGGLFVSGTHHAENPAVERARMVSEDAQKRQPGEVFCLAPPGWRDRDQLGLACRPARAGERVHLIAREDGALTPIDALDVRPEAFVSPDGDRLHVALLVSDGGEAMLSPEDGLCVAIEELAQYGRLRPGGVGAGGFEASVLPPRLELEEPL